MMEADRKSQYSQRYERPASPYNPQPYIQPDYATGPSEHHSHASRESSAPDITVVPPVRQLDLLRTALVLMIF